MSVTSRWRSTRASSSASSRSRPTNDVSWTGRFVRRVLSERSGGNSLRQVGDRDLEDLLGPVEVAQPMRAQVAQLDAGRQAVAGQDRRHRRAEDLAAVADARGSGRSG